jgi:hypothetical protein
MKNQPFKIQYKSNKGKELTDFTFEATVKGSLKILNGNCENERSSSIPRMFPIYMPNIAQFWLLSLK